MQRNMFTVSPMFRVTFATAGLALVAVLALAGVLNLVSFTGTDPVEASSANISQNLPTNTDLGKLTEPFASPLAATADITGGGGGGGFTTPTIQQSPDTPGANALYTIRFNTSVALANGIDDIVFHLDSEFQVPATLDRNQISISSSSVTGGAANEAVPPLEVTIDLVGTENDEPEITLVIGDMDSSDNSGGNGIAAGAEVTVIFRQAAGIKNPTEQGFDSWSVRTSQDTTEVQTTDEDSALADAGKGPFTPAIIEMSSADGPRVRT